MFRKFRDKRRAALHHSFCAKKRNYENRKCTSRKIIIIKFA